jgi:hypothetical protein
MSCKPYASLLVSETAGKNFGQETVFRSLSIDNFSIAQLFVCHVVLWAAFFRAVFLSEYIIIIIIIIMLTM